MSQKTIILIVTLFVLIIIGMFSYAHLKKVELEAVPTPSEEEQAPSVPYPNITRIDAKHYFIDGVHTLVGEIEMPTPCDLVESSALVMESYPEQVMVDFTVINNADICTQVITAQRFKVAFQASENASIKAVFMGREVTLNLIPAAAGETPDEFELFIKG
ncbi:hypothetical protein KC902_00185 [Candidatus Kaiserbacteria bacterium]|nr:hypothetical protein [Candidatus Kaiserbacteria bacterium]USN88655.1 MAG: hypothetical protein H6780_04170 [Candidatus Nomurabacteria bacterium]